MRPALYYGLTPWGHRIHLGDEVEYEEGKLTKVDTFCGAIMKAPSEGSMPEARRADSFCRNCFRGIAWETFQEKMKRRAERESQINQPLPALRRARQRVKEPVTV